MFDHVTYRASSLAESDRFYTTVLGALGIEADSRGEMGPEWQDFSLAQAGKGKPVTTHCHVGFVASSRAAVDAFWQAGVEAGYRSDGEPGERDYTDAYYGAFLLDPDGNSAEAVHKERLRSDGHVDHVWIRVADVDAVRAFYATIAGPAGIERDGDAFRRAGPGGGWLVAVTGSAVTTGLHLAFPAPDRATVDAFHAAAVGAGHQDNGAPGERPEYHDGYYGAFVFDPAGTNVESVFHDRPA